MKTQIVASDQSTIVIGGLIQERATRSVKKVPVLGSLPVLGGLFRDTQNIKQKTNLLVFLTPYIIRDEADYRRIYEQKRKEQEDFMVQFYGRKSGYDGERRLRARPARSPGSTRAWWRRPRGSRTAAPGLPGEGMSSPVPAGPAGRVPAAGRSRSPARSRPRADPSAGRTAAPAPSPAPLQPQGGDEE